MGKWLRKLAVLATAVAPLWCAAPASAAPGDARFVQQLDSAGIEISDPPALVGNLARTLCTLLQNNWTIGTAKYSVLSEYPDLTETQARQFVVLSMENYCPSVGSS